MTPWATRLLLVNVIVFVLQQLRPELVSLFRFVPAVLLDRPWTLVTYMFLHGSMWHLLFNMLGIFFFAPRLEDNLGAGRFLILYFASGIAGALLSFTMPYGGIVGASGGVYGILLGFAYLWPRERIFLWGVLPVEARILVIMFTAMSLYGGLSSSDDEIAHFAHLGGFIGGFICMRVFQATTREARFKRSLEASPLRQVNLDRWKSIRREHLHEVNRQEFDRILDKINRQGVESLTPTETEFLNRFSSD